MPLCSYGEHVETVNVLADETPVTWMDIKDLADTSVITLIVCSKHLIAAIVAISGLGTIALCRPGAAAWSVSAHEQCMWLSDMVFFQGKLYAIDTKSLILRTFLTLTSWMSLTLIGQGYLVLSASLREIPSHPKAIPRLCSASLNPMEHC